MSEFTVENLDSLCQRVWELRQVKDADKKRLEESLLQLEEAENDLLAALEKSEKDKWEINECKVSVTHRTSVKVPKELEQKRALFDYLREQGIFEELVNVNSQTLNAYYREQLEKKLEEGDVTWTLPGVGEATTTKGLQVRKKQSDQNN